MKKIFAAILAMTILLLTGCAAARPERTGGIAATTAPVAELTGALLDGTGVTVEQLITEPVSCLHDYTLSVEQMKLAESSSLIVISGMGLEDFMEDVLRNCTVIDASAGIAPLPGEEGDDPHIWLDPANLRSMTKTVSAELQKVYPDKASVIAANEKAYCEKLDELTAYGKEQLAALSCRKLVTFHDGFSYFAKAFGLEIAAAMEVEPGSEPSAKELEAVIATVIDNGIPAVFTEVNGTTDAAELVGREAGVKAYPLNMAMSLENQTYFDVMKKNIDTIKDVLG